MHEKSSKIALKRAVAAASKNTYIGFSEGERQRAREALQFFSIKSLRKTLKKYNKKSEKG